MFTFIVIVFFKHETINKELLDGIISYISISFEVQYEVTLIVLFFKRNNAKNFIVLPGKIRLLGAHFYKLLLIFQ